MKNPKRVRAGRLVAARRDDARWRFLHDVEGHDPSLLFWARRLERKVPLRPRGMSRLEYFLQLVHDDPHGHVDAMQADADDWVRKLAREQWKEDAA